MAGTFGLRCHRCHQLFSMHGSFYDCQRAVPICEICWLSCAESQEFELNHGITVQRSYDEPDVFKRSAEAAQYVVDTKAPKRLLVAQSLPPGPITLRELFDLMPPTGATRK